VTIAATAKAVSTERAAATVAERPGEWAEHVLKLAEKIAAQRRREETAKADGATSKSER
jgi:hypothetical protein